ncbi:MAG: hypothetical protein ACP5OP_01245 [Leptospirillia bacterium]
MTDGSVGGRRRTFSARRLSLRMIKGLRSLFFGGAGMVLVGMLIVIGGCEDVKPLTPEQQSFMSAWKIGKNLGKAFATQSPKAVEALLGPPLSLDPKTHAGLVSIFAVLDKIDLRIVMDSGTVDETGHAIVFHAHWTMSAISKGPKKAGARYFQTGEARMVVGLSKPPGKARLLSLTGDTFLRTSIGAKSPG